MEITERVAYLKGLAEGMELNTDKREGKLLAAIIDVLEDRQSFYHPLYHHSHPASYKQ